MFRNSQSAMELVAIRGLCLHCLHICTRVQKNLNPIFAEYVVQKLNCTSHSVYKSFELLLPFLMITCINI